MSDHDVTIGRLCLAGFSKAEAAVIAAKLDGDTAAPQAPATAAAQPAPAAPTVPAEFVEAMEGGAPPAGYRYTEEQIRSFTAADFARMDEGQWAEVQKVLASLGPKRPRGRQ
jgi:hypothetical protein